MTIQIPKSCQKNEENFQDLSFGPKIGSKEWSKSARPLITSCKGPLKVNFVGSNDPIAQKLTELGPFNLFV